MENNIKQPLEAVVSNTSMLPENTENCNSISNNKASFLLYNEQIEVFEALTNEQAGELIKAIYRYETAGIMPNLNGILKIAFIPIKQQLDKNKIKYNEFREKQRQNGLKGGRPKTQNNPKKTNGFSENPKNPSLFSETQKSLYVNVYDNVYNNNSSSSSIDNSSKEENKTAAKKFKKPSLEEIKNYCIERNSSISPEKFFDYYETIGWVIGKSRTPMKDWQAAVRSWEAREKQTDNKQGGADDAADYNPNL